MALSCCDTYQSWKAWKSRRYTLALLAFLGYIASYIMRVNLSVAVVAMTETKTIENNNGSITYVKDFTWNSKLQGFLLGSFFYGYLSTHLLGGWLASKFGGVRVYGVSQGFTAILSLFVPLAAKHSYSLLLAIRLLQGMVEGPSLPSIYVFWAHWAPLLERSKLIASTVTGGFVGTVIGMPFAAYLNSYMGWESTFYVPGAIGLLWYICWWRYISETPSKDKYINHKELQYITDSLGSEAHHKSVKHPWRSIVTSPPAVACMIAHFVQTYAFDTMLTQLPKFMTDVLHFDLKKAGTLSAVPFLLMTIVLLTGGHLVDYLGGKNIFHIGILRKLFTCGPFLFSAVLLALATYLLSPIATSILLTIAVGFGGLSWAGFGHASVIFGIGGTLATLAGIISPTVTGYVVTTPTNEEWQIVFYIVSGVYIIGCVLYGCMASGELQPWAQEPQQNEAAVTTPT